MTEPKIFGLVSIKNEAHRYLQSMLWNLNWLVDEIFVYDDQSTDDSFEIANETINAGMVVRSTGNSTFAHHEGDFRKEAWDQFCWNLRPQPNDWIVALDADEFLVSTTETSTYYTLRQEVKNAGAVDAMRVAIPEVWATDPVQIRIDGYWNRNRHQRIYRNSTKTKFLDKVAGSGPSTVSARYPADTYSLEILHYGYADPEDLKAKYERYSAGAHGHNNKHIESIPDTPVLKEYVGNVPKVWRGIR